MRPDGWKLRGLTATAALAGVVLVACSSPGPETLVDRSFSSTSVLEGGNPKELYSGTTLQISFIKGELNATGGCNAMFGTADLADGRIKVTNELAASTMACLPEIMAQDDWLRDFLTSNPAWSLDGDTLTLTNDTATITMQDVAPS